MMLKEYLQNHSSDRNFNNADVLDILVSCVDEHCDEEKICHVIKKIHEQLFGKHFDEDCALRTVAKMFYYKDDTSTAKVFGAFIPFETSQKIFARTKDMIHKDYNVFDFYVAQNMIYSDNYNLYKKWFKDVTDEAMLNIVTEHTVQWLNDPDSPYSDGTKIWSYLKH